MNRTRKSRATTCRFTISLATRIWSGRWVPTPLLQRKRIYSPPQLPICYSPRKMVPIKYRQLPNLLKIKHALYHHLCNFVDYSHQLFHVNHPTYKLFALGFNDFYLVISEIIYLATPRGLEPLALAVTALRSNQKLSYGAIYDDLGSPTTHLPI